MMVGHHSRIAREFLVTQNNNITMPAPLTDTHMILEGFLDQKAHSPVVLASRNDTKLYKFWLLGVAEGASIGLAVAINHLTSPEHRYAPEEIMRRIIAPLVETNDLGRAEGALRDLVASAWAR
jgi:hypothetical protein